jgi:poly(3-hydroxybutyrate) depolymerase
LDPRRQPVTADDLSEFSGLFRYRRTGAGDCRYGSDDIRAVGQTLAAHELCSGIMKRHHIQTGVGHYGVFNGRRWSSYIYPISSD